MTFDGEDLYPEIEDKAAALMHSLVTNRPFVDGNKRVGTHACLLLLMVDGVEPMFSPAELAAITLATARGLLSPALARGPCPREAATLGGDQAVR
jgi:death on curing protein